MPAPPKSRPPGRLTAGGTRSPKQTRCRPRPDEDDEPPPLDPDGRPLCRHCRERPGCGDRRGLCRPCYANPRIRARYQWLRQQFGRRWEYGKGWVPVPEAPTKARAGSRAKIRAMIRRREAGRQLHHPGDALNPDADFEALRMAVVYAGVKGVEIGPGDPPRWRARPRCRGRRVHLGYFTTRAAACLAVLEWRAAGCPPDVERWRGSMEADDEPPRVAGLPRRGKELWGDDTDV